MQTTDAEVAVAAATAGAAVVARDYGRRHQRAPKSATDFATETDLDAEHAVIAVLEASRPRDARTGEETGATGGPGVARRWLVDPLCGTLNFAATTPLAVVNVALSEHGEVRVAAAADPLSGETFWTDGIAAYVRNAEGDQRLEPAAVSRLVDVNCDGPLDRPFLGGQLVADPRLRSVFGPRVISSTLAVAWVAAGRRAAYVTDGQLRDNVHFAAGIAICTAARCVVSDLAGDPLHTGRGLVISADRPTHDRLLEFIAPHLRAL
ncbi:MAG TPA: phosphatase [Nocardioides bacterium]|uniref:inositol monophosphatase family protein n=1 Tax=uncultured Nocardioides sp. TaxID=198441 RepID=UPI000ECAD68A|nr:inositol monophosphatase family protein [uncultured Nocardioides sp.]HCB03460.1 phosphatase [Nocardioides sp.]HRK48182.1 inositol monophosphatase family protein [Nocardioides sp.]